MGLRQEDLKDMVYRVFEVDSFKSKMGDDKDIVTISFSVKEQAAAKDLENFIEKGYNFVLDADATPGEQSDGTYKVFVEIERNRHVPEQIMEIVDGVKKLSGLDELKYRYYKNFKSVDASEESLSETIPLDSDSYDGTIQEARANNYKEFFNRSYVEDISMLEESIIIQKKYADPLLFKFVDFGPAEETINAINESFNANDFSEIIFLSKYVGDYNITKYGNKLTFENNNNVLVLERISV
jgi:hypothetical protein